MLLPVGMLALSEADIIATAALTHARSQNMSPLAVAVVDAAGTMKCLRCEDGAALMRPNIAYSKAWGCVGLGISTRKLFDLVQQMPQMVPAFQSFMGISENRLLPSPGGVLILRADAVIGAVGVSGDHPDHDEACALAGIERAGLASFAVAILLALICGPLNR